MTVVFIAFFVTACTGSASQTDHGGVVWDGSVLPDLVSHDLNYLGDETGILYELHDAIGIQSTVSVASDSVPAGSVVSMEPPAGTRLDEIDMWTLYVSDGGPVIAPDDLPRDVLEFAASLPGFDPDELLIARSVCVGADEGDCAEAMGYKSDLWLFGTNCAAVDQLYRTFRDGQYRTACPGSIEGR